MSETDSGLAREQMSDRSSSRYDLDNDELEQLGARMVEYVEENVQSDGIVSLWIDPAHQFADFVRTHEASYFPEVADVTNEDESNTVFIALIDTREGVKRVVHGVTVMFPRFMQEGLSVAENADLNGVETTGFYTIDSLIDRGNFTADEFAQYYTDKGVDLAQCFSVETNFRIGERPELIDGLKPADVVYISLFERIMKKKPPVGQVTMFATVNRSQIQSFERAGLQYEPIMGRTDLDTEESELGIESLPISIVDGQYVRDLMDSMVGHFPQLKAE